MTSAPIYLAPDIRSTVAEDGTIYLESRLGAPDVPASLLVYLKRWAERRPDTVFLAERRDPDESWTYLRYGEALSQCRILASALVEAGLSPGRPIMTLSGNSIATGLLSLTAMYLGVPVVPVSPSYSLLSKDFQRVRHIVELIDPGLIFVEDHAAFQGVLESVGTGSSLIAARENVPTSGSCLSWSDLLSAQPGRQVPEQEIGPDTVAKILFTSGSTGMPKGVVNTHRMLTSNQEALATVWPFINEPGHVFLDWLPWHHTFGGNHNFNMVLRNGATLYIDHGKPTPDGIRLTVANLGQVSPTVYFNVASGYEALLSHLEADPALARSFFKDLRVVFFAAAALPMALWDRLSTLIETYAARPIPITSAWGTTETAPLCTSVHFDNGINNNIGVPIPGTLIKLAPVDGKMELRVKGPNVTPGYYREPALTQKLFDQEGYFCSGDAVAIADAAVPESGLLFDGRISENFKLLSGTWVNVGSLRVDLVSKLSPLVTDVVIAGHDRHQVAILVFPNLAACRSHLGDDGLESASLAGHEALQEELRARLARHNAENHGSSRRVARAVILDSPPSIDRNEITDKGYVNQRAVLEQRAEAVRRLYAETPDGNVIVV